MFMNRIGQPRFSGLLQRFFGMKGEVNPAPILAPEIAPSYDVNQMDDPTLLYLRGERRFAAYVNIGAGGAGNWSAAQLRNPVDSNTLAIVEEQFLFCSTINVLAALQIGLAAYVNVQAPSPLDSRFFDAGTNYRPACGVTSSTALVASPAGFVIDTQLQTQVQRITRPVVLSPGFSMTWYPNLANSALIAVIYWRERVINQDELRTG